MLGLIAIFLPPGPPYRYASININNSMQFVCEIEKQIVSIEYSEIWTPSVLKKKND